MAIGEAGLIIFMTIPLKKHSKKFRVQIQAARELDLPIIIHSRNVDEDMASIIEEEYYKLSRVFYIVLVLKRPGKKSN